MRAALPFLLVAFSVHAADGMPTQSQKVTQSTSPWVTADTHTTAAAPISCRLTDGASFYTASGSGGGGLTDTQLRATAVPVSGTFWPGTQPVSGSVSVSNFPASQAVTGTFWQATQPVSGTFWQATQPVSGPLTDTQLRASAVPVSGTFWQATQPVSGPLTDTQLRASAVPVSGNFFQATQPVSGTVTANAGTGTMAVSGPLTDTQLRATPVPVSGTVTANAGTGTLSTNVAQLAGTTATTGGAAGSLGVGGINANNASITQNPMLQGVEVLSSQPTAATTGNVRRLVGSLDGALYVRPGGPVTFTCGLNGIAASLTQCQAAPAAGLRLYVTDVSVQTTTATSGTYAIQTGTGTNCATGTAALFPVSGTANRFNAPINTTAMAQLSFSTPLAAPAASAICLIGVATNTISVQITGYTAP